MQAILVAVCLVLIIGGPTVELARAADCALAEQLTAEARQVVPSNISLAEQKLREALELCPQSAAIPYNLGILLYMRRQYQEATAKLEESLAITPDYAPSLNALAFLLLGQARQQPRALGLASQAVDLAVGNAEYLDTLARIQALEAVGHGRDGPPTPTDSATGPVLWVQAQPGDPPGAAVVLGGPGAAAVSRYLAGGAARGATDSLVPVQGEAAARLVGAVGAQTGEVFRLAGADYTGLYVVLARLPGGKDVQTLPSPKARACGGRATHEVRAGDTLGLIARRHYGDSSLWEAIYTCNRESIGADPGLLTPGSTLVIP